MANYYQNRNYISNSELGNLFDALTLRQKPGNIQDIYNFGSVVDALITEDKLVDMEHRAVVTSDGEFTQFTPEEFNKALDMRRDAFADPLIAMMLPMMKFQAEFYIDMFPIEGTRNPAYLPVKGKLDGTANKIRTGMDLKTTGCTTEKAFIESISHFNYDRQGYSYMDIADLDRFWFVGIGKNKGRDRKHPIFKFCIQRGDKVYNAGKEKYHFLARKYYYLIHQFNMR